jgi:hypothetical protein
MKPEIPSELHSIAVSPALPATPSEILVGVEQFGRKPIIHQTWPVGGHSLLDLYFCAIVRSPDLFYVQLEDPDEALDRATSLAWRLAISAVRTRPDTGPVPAALPKGDL